MLCDDVIIEIFKQLDFDLPAFYSTCKRFYKLFEENQKSLLTEGRYRFSPSQHELVENLRYKMRIDTKNSIGMKAAVLHYAFNYPENVLIITPKSELEYWRKEVDRLYDHDKKSQITIGPIFDQNKITITTDILFTNCRKIYYKLFGDHVTSVIKSDVFIKTIHLECYRSEAVDYIYLAPLLLDSRSQTERLYQMIKQIVNKNRGDYLIIDDNKYEKNIEYNDIPNISIKKLLSLDVTTVTSVRTIIFLWPGHYALQKLKETYQKLSLFPVRQLNLYCLHSTIEEAFLIKCMNGLPLLKQKAKLYGYKILQCKRNKLEFLELMRQLILKYNFNLLYQLDDYLFTFYMYITKIDLIKIENLLASKLEGKIC